MAPVLKGARLRRKKSERRQKSFSWNSRMPLERRSWRKGRTRFLAFQTYIHRTHTHAHMPSIPPFMQFHGGHVELRTLFGTRYSVLGTRYSVLLCTLSCVLSVLCIVPVYCVLYTVRCTVYCVLSPCVRVDKGMTSDCGSR
jgi:hypothetical protein